MLVSFLILLTKFYNMKQILTSLPLKIVEKIQRISRWDDQFEVEFFDDTNIQHTIKGTRKEIILGMRKFFNLMAYNSKQEICDTAINMVCSEYFLTPERLKEKTRKREIVEARQVAMNLVYQRFKDSKLISLADIGKYIGDKDHATVLHAAKTVNNLFDTSHPFRERYEVLELNYNEIFKDYDETIKIGN